MDGFWPIQKNKDGLCAAGERDAWKRYKYPINRFYLQFQVMSNNSKILLDLVNDISRHIGALDAYIEAWVLSFKKDMRTISVLN